jgi:hypothetical protein
MALIVEDKKKVYEKPDSGTFVAVIADVVDLGPKPTKYGIKNKIRLVWVLGKLAAFGGGYANDTEGNPFRVMSSFNATMNEGGDLYKMARSILGTAPPVPYDVEQLLGKVNLLFIVKEENEKKKGDFYANVKGVLPLGNEVALAIPATFVRSKDRVDTRTGVQAAPVSNISANLTGTAVAGTPVAPAVAATPAPVAAAVAPAEVVLDAKF